MMRGIGAALVVGMIASAAACGRSAAPLDEAGSAEQSADAVTVVVQNDYSEPMDIYAYSGGRTTRLGAVMPGKRSTFVLDAAMMPTGFVKILANAPGGHGVVHSTQLHPTARHTVEFDIGFNLAESRATIR